MDTLKWVITPEYRGKALFSSYEGEGLHTPLVQAARWTC